MLATQRLSVEMNQQTLLEAINFELQPGEILHIKGANGSGKSTLLKTIAGLIEPSAGEVLFNGQSTSQNRYSFQQSLAYLGHKLGLKSSLTARENIGRILIDIMDIVDFSNKLLEGLSAGQKQRVALTRVINSGATLWLLDEPFTALDQKSISQFNGALTTHLKQGGITIISSHQSVLLHDLSVKTLDLSELSVC